MVDNFFESIKCFLNVDEKLELSKGGFFFGVKGK